MTATQSIVYSGGADIDDLHAIVFLFN